MTTFLIIITIIAIGVAVLCVSAIYELAQRVDALEEAFESMAQTQNGFNSSITKTVGSNTKAISETIDALEMTQKTISTLLQ